VFPGAVNSVPSRTLLELDVRDVDEARRDAVLERIAVACDGIARRRQVTVTRQLVNADPPAVCAPAVVAAIECAARAQGLKSQPMVSRAYHDSLFMSRVAPAGMIFIPCRGGVSHRPDEYASPHAIAQGAGVLAGALSQLSES
jgi:N-carbamoyl-L-amino-acid hydrolase